MTQRSPFPMRVADPTETQRQIALAIPLHTLGIGEGPPMWLVFCADKTTGELTCAIRSVLPNAFITD